MKTIMTPKIDRQRHNIDASGKILGRLATEVAVLLRGKNKSYFVNHLDVGDFVTVFNPEKIRVSGNKLTDKIYRHHTGYIGHLKEITLADKMAKDPIGVIRAAVSGMLPKNRLHKKWVKRLDFKINQINVAGKPVDNKSEEK